MNNKIYDDDYFKKRIFEKHLQLGSGKPLSYLPISTIENSLKITVDEYQNMHQNYGNESMVFFEGQCAIKSGAVYGYNKNSLESLLIKFTPVLIFNDWPNTPETFIEKIANIWIKDENHPLMEVIRAVFGD